jgi:tetratricopeptide (TPR) repeat protein
MDKVFEALQEEKNLVHDLSNEWKKKLQLANIDFLVVGDLNENLASNNYNLLINFIQITGNNMTSKFPMLITLNREQLSNNDELIKIFDKEIQSFLKSYFIIENEDNSLTAIPKFYEELKKRDSTIAYLTTTVNTLQIENGIKNQEIKKLDQNISNLRSYSHMAKLDIYGLEFHVGYGLKGGETSLSLLMKNILETKENKTFIILNDTALGFANQVIKKYPNFPFGYYAKAKILFSKNDIRGGIESALKAVEIFEITTTIDGHSVYHDQAMEDLKLHMLTPLSIK